MFSDRGCTYGRSVSCHLRYSRTCIVDVLREPIVCNYISLQSLVFSLSPSEYAPPPEEWIWVLYERVMTIPAAGIILTLFWNATWSVRVIWGISRCPGVAVYKQVYPPHPPVLLYVYCIVIRRHPTTADSVPACWQTGLRSIAPSTWSARRFDRPSTSLAWTRSLLKSSVRSYWSCCGSCRMVLLVQEHTAHRGKWTNSIVHLPTSTAPSTDRYFHHWNTSIFNDSCMLLPRKAAAFLLVVGMFVTFCEMFGPKFSTTSVVPDHRA